MLVFPGGEGEKYMNSPSTIAHHIRTVDGALFCDSFDILSTGPIAHRKSLCSWGVEHRALALEFKSLLFYAPLKDCAWQFELAVNYSASHSHRRGCSVLR